LGQQENARNNDRNGARDITRKPHLAHLKVYRCRAYAITRNAQKKINRLAKLEPRAHIGYLVGYNSINIFRIWILHQGVIISTRDVIFNKNTRFDGKKENLADVLIKERDKLIKKIRIPEILAVNKRIVQEDNDLIELDKDNTIVVDTGDLY
jgi:hypothetical protein